jgi:hypothetical protein
MRATGVALVTVLVTATVVLGSLYDEGGFDASLLLVGVWAVLGAVIAALRPRNPVGWLFLAFGLWMGIGLALSSAPEHLGTGALLTWVSWLSEWFWLVAFGIVIASLFFIPTGRLPSRRWLPVLVVFSLAVGACAITAALQGTLQTTSRAPVVRNPVGIRDFGDIETWGGPILIAVLVGGAAAGAASLVVRYRSGNAEERQGLKLVALAGPFAVLCVVVQGIWGVEPLKSILWDLGMTAIPAAVAAAILRYRLFDVDLLISRTLVYGTLTVLLGLAYAGLVLASQAVFSSFAGGSNLAIAVSTLVVAALFLPLRGRVQRFVDRRFYRRRYDAARTLEAFSVRVRHEVELEGLLADLHHTVRETMEPAHVSLWLRGAPQQ